MRVGHKLGTKRRVFFFLKKKLLSPPLGPKREKVSVGWA